jgi:ATP-dependent helicase/nuclease subunit A
LDGANEISENDDVVRIMSIHKSKGLEFPVVFVANCSSSTNVADFSKVKINRKLGVAAPRYFPELHKNFNTLQLNAIKLYEGQEETAEHIRVLYVAMTRAEEKLYLVGSMYNPEKKITDLYYECYDKNNESAVPVSMCSSYMKWIMLSMMNHPSLSLETLLNTRKDAKNTEFDFGIFKKCENPLVVSTEDKIFECDKEILDIISNRLVYQYPFSSLSDIPVKYAASAINSDENLKYLASENPAFSGTGELTPAQRGTLTHRFMEICDLTKANEDLIGEINRTVENKVLTQKEADSLNIKAIKSFFESGVYKRISSAEYYVREQEFSMSVPVSYINKALPDNVQDETVIVQGVMDGIIINGNNGEILDFKTDRVSTEDELCERYKEQMSIYKKAAEECFGLQNITVTLYSFHLSKEISLKL